MALFRFEKRTDPLATHVVFASRIGANLVVAMLIIGAALGAGMAGYRLTEQMDWLEAFLNAAMLLGGMGPVDTLHTDNGKLFAGLYALFCGLVIVLTTGVVLAPALHRVLHALHAADTSD
jgi:hypothetical protein